MIIFKKLQLFTLLILFSFPLFATDSTLPSVDLYGFVRNDLYFNSRQNVESADGLFNILPKPRDIDGLGNDLNDKPNSEMLSVATRLGLDLKGNLQVFGAKTSAKIEFDFAGIATNYYLIRLRQAYMKLNWTDQTELIIGQTWHPMFGNVFPTLISLNTGAPFQPFNRSPQIRLTENIAKNLSVIAAANYQMQYMSQGPVGPSPSYLKSALLPSFFLGLETKTKHWTSGVGFDTKTIKINYDNLSSFSAMVYSQYAKQNLLVKAKVILGENMSDHLMIGGYGVAGFNASTQNTDYTNFNNLSYWINIVYGKQVQIGVFSGITQNLGTNQSLLSSPLGKFTAYGYGFNALNQTQLDKLHRISAFVAYNASNIKIAFEYELTDAIYGVIERNGRVKNPYSITNHRALASISYFF